MLEKILQELAAHQTQLVAVSKTHPASTIRRIYDAGQRDFGENKVQEITDKQEELPADIRWHFIGHLQTNKVKYITPFVHLIHSVDSAKVLKEINKRAGNDERRVDCLLQFKIAEEDTKYGLTLAEARELLQSDRYRAMENIRIVGVMGMATFTDDEQQVRTEFRRLKTIFDTLKQEFFADADHFKEISMGMSGDYQLAMEEGSTMVRIGSLIFGERDYQ
ncbi:YggS family pyridoxal phosphate-dependent enzyme [Flavilitoribacter nigricans]|uniref:Pyridoxal phosphate homeostasis protein n=1 Tax=Flavilitoribacter nigricans (strain ATCC 23147 / DSM 23189 / NBRC 102662 / NCIMB 1420 / SS-2) TaxID=1122177 RepID=A0A2D0NHL2_FLAN2|nr:YggS family pyridoxal phosphate-dependent enzyme [Flavilitoribacter nigricans]PHN07992.1 YggS family pyridoxal phosphate-dependent enzyme [Flavilitoribacter nigricans DSM 23189 = NBRC 102662]